MKDYFTPIHALPRLGKQLNLDQLYIKREDLISYYGNKTRHAYSIMSRLLSSGVKSIELIGRGDSNCMRIYVMAAVKMGFTIKLSLTSPLSTGNGKIIGMFNTVETADFQLRCDELKAQATNGYIKVSEEISKQLPNVDYIYLCSYDASWIGLSVGNELFSLHPEIIATRGIIGSHGSVGTDSDKKYINTVYEQVESSWNVKVANRRITRIGISRRCDDVVKKVLNLEGILLDWRYTGGAMLQLMLDASSKRIPRESVVLFIHTGGVFLNC